MMTRVAPSPTTFDVDHQGPKPRRPRWPAVALVGAAAAIAVATVAIRDTDPSRAVGSPDTVATVDTPNPGTTGPGTAIAPDSTASDPGATPDLEFDWADEISVVVRTNDRVAVLHGDGSADWYDPGVVSGTRAWQVGGRLIGGTPMDLVEVANFHQIADTLGPEMNLVEAFTPGGDGRYFLLIRDGRAVPLQAERLTLGADRLVGQVVTSSGWRPVAYTLDGTEIDSFIADIGIGDQSALCDCPRLFSISPTDMTLAWVDGDELVTIVAGVARRYALSDGFKIIDIDLTDEAVVLNRAAGAATLVDLRDGTSTKLPLEGYATVAIGVDPSTPVGVTTTILEPDAAPPPQLPEDFTWIVQLPEGIRSVGGADPSDPIPDTTLSGNRETLAFTDGAGGVVYQRRDGPWMHWTGFDNPVVELFAALDFAGPMNVLDVAMVDGEPMALISVAIGCNAPETPADCEVRGYVMPFGQGSTTVSLGVIGGWEFGSELSLGEGLVIGWEHNLASTAPVALRLDRSQSEVFVERGMDVWYGDCRVGAACPREFTVSHDGTKVVWIDDGGSLVVAAPGRAADDVRLLDGFVGWDVVDVSGDFIGLRSPDMTSVIGGVDDLGVATIYPVEGRFLGFRN